MGIERSMQYECRVCGRKIDVTRTGDVYEEPVYCCGLEAGEVNISQIPTEPQAPGAPAVKKPARKKARKKPAKKKAKKKATKKKAAKKKAKKKATRKKASRKKAVKRKAAKKKAKRRR